MENRTTAGRMLFIMNPNAGTRRAAKYLNDIFCLFAAKGWEPLVCMTQKRGDGTELVRSHAGEADMVVAVGGDGTLNEVITGLMLTGWQVPLGYIPAGSTNDFATSLKLPKTILKAAELIAEGTPRTLDVGRFCEDRYFSYVASFGAFTKASYATPQSAKNFLGHLAYILGAVKELGNIHPYQMKVEIPGETFEESFIFGGVSNSTSLGGVLTLDPQYVDMNDGLLEMLFVRSPSGPAELNECIRAVTSKDYDSRMLLFRSTPWVRITGIPDVDWTLDGEFAPGRETVEIRNLPNAIRLVTGDQGSDGEREEDQEQEAE